MSFGPLPITLISDYCDCFSSSGLDLSARGQASPSSCLSKTLSASTTLAEKHFLNCTEGGSPRCSIRGRFQDTLHCPCSSRLLLLPRQLRNYQIRRKGTRYRLEGGWGGIWEQLPWRKHLWSQKQGETAAAEHTTSTPCCFQWCVNQKPLLRCHLLEHSVSISG